MKSTTLTVLLASAVLGTAAFAQSEPPAAPTQPPAMQPVPPLSPRDRADAFVERFDANGDGAVTADEIEAYRLRHFSAADADGDGMLSASEFVEMGRMMDEERRQMRAEAMVERLDRDGNGLISPEELPQRGGPGGWMGPDGDGMYGRMGPDGEGDHGHMGPKGEGHHGRMGMGGAFDPEMPHHGKGDESPRRHGH